MKFNIFNEYSSNVMYLNSIGLKFFEILFKYLKLILEIYKNYLHYISINFIIINHINMVKKYNYLILVSCLYRLKLRTIWKF